MTTPPEYLVAHVAGAFATDPMVAAQDLEVRLVDGTLLVVGAVESEDRHAAALAVARRTADGVPVRDGITILELHDPVHPEELR